MRQKGQASVEFIILFVILLAYIYTISEPSVQVAQDSINDISRVSQSRLAAEKLAAAINELLVSDGLGKKTIHVVVPENSKITCDYGNPADPTPEIFFTTDLSANLAGITVPGKCVSPATGTKYCTGGIPVISGNFVCSAPGYYTGKAYWIFRVYKNPMDGKVHVE